MIDEKKIEEAAYKYAIDTYAFDEPVPTEYKEGIQEVFQTSINWFKKNLWHDASEEPEKNKLCLVKIDIIDGFKIASDYTTSSFSDNGWTENYFPDDYDVNVSRWLYIEDLMKGGK